MQNNQSITVEKENCLTAMFRRFIVDQRVICWQSAWLSITCWNAVMNPGVFKESPRILMASQKVCLSIVVCIVWRQFRMPIKSTGYGKIISGSYNPYNVGVVQQNEQRLILVDFRSLLSVVHALKGCLPARSIIFVRVKKRLSINQATSTNL